MKTTQDALFVVLIFMATSLLPACSSLQNANQALVAHPKKCVRYPANAGQAVGTVVGIPVGIVLALPTMAVYHFLPVDEETKGWSGLFPFVVCQQLGTVIIGGIPWCGVGWWGVPESEPKEVVNTTARWPMGTYVETPDGSMIVGDASSKTGEFSAEQDKGAAK